MPRTRCGFPRAGAGHCCERRSRRNPAAPRQCPRSRRICRVSSGSWGRVPWRGVFFRSEEHTSELQSLTNLVCRLLLEKKKKKNKKKQRTRTKTKEMTNATKQL